MNVLLALRIHQPTTMLRLAGRLHRNPFFVNADLWTGVDRGLVVVDKAWEWRLTSAGRRMVDHHEVEVTAVRRDEAMACVGVSQL